MNDQHYFADVDLPFHVWVRERAPGRGFRWVLREAPHLARGAPSQAVGQGSEGATGRQPGGSR